LAPENLLPPLRLRATDENVRRVETLKTATPIINAAVGEQRLLIVGGVYRLATGQVDGLRAFFTGDRREKGDDSLLLLHDDSGDL
jgi:carbonic anhydrase